MPKVLQKRVVESDSDNSESELLDEQQQEREIESLESNHKVKKSSVKWILFVVGLLFAGVNGFNIYKLGYSIPKVFTLASFLEATFRVLIVADRLKYFSLAFSFSGVASFIVMMRDIPRFMDEDLAYFPIVYNAIIQLFLVDMLSEENDIEELKKLRYHLKGA